MKNVVKFLVVAAGICSSFYLGAFLGTAGGCGYGTGKAAAQLGYPEKKMMEWCRRYEDTNDFWGFVVSRIAQRSFKDHRKES